MIGKTRHERATPIAMAKAKPAEVEEVYDPEVGRARGMLRRPLPAGKLKHARRRPAADLAPWIAHYWMIHWDLRGCEPHKAESVPHPNVHVIFEPAASVVCGVQTRKFSRMIEGQSQVFGIKFKPGGFRSFVKFPVSKLADRTVPVKRILGTEADSLQEFLLSSRRESEKVEATNAFFRAHA
ncbi:MAG: DUF6597 domain-containing transcriptional factor [Terriglobales bacterium]